MFSEISTENLIPFLYPFHLWNWFKCIRNRQFRFHIWETTTIQQCIQCILFMLSSWEHEMHIGLNDLRPPNTGDMISLIMNHLILRVRILTAPKESSIQCKNKRTSIENNEHWVLWKYEMVMCQWFCNGFKCERTSKETFCEDGNFW